MTDDGLMDGWIIIIGHRSSKSTFGANEMFMNYRKRGSFSLFQFFLSLSFVVIILLSTKTTKHPSQSGCIRYASDIRLIDLSL